MPLSNREVLEEALQKDPDDRATHMAYADLLMEEGDPRGELIRVQIDLEDESKSTQERNQLRGREAELFRLHRDRFWDDLAPFVYRPNYLNKKGYYYEPEWFIWEHRWRRGWIDQFQLLLAEALDTREIVQRLNDAPILQLVRELQFGHLEDIAEFELLANIVWLSQLKSFTFGDEEGKGVYESEGLDQIISRMENLEELRMWTRFANADTLFTSPFSKLRILEIECFLDSPAEEIGLTQNLPNLERLVLHPHAADYDQEVILTLGGFQAVCRSPHLPKLKHLAYRCSNMGDQGVRELIDSGILKRLTSLDLSHGCITSRGAEELLASSDFKHLKILDITDNWISATSMAKLRLSGVNVISENQSREGNNNYLYHGDFE